MRAGWVPFHASLCEGDKRGLPRAVRFVYLEFVQKARAYSGRLPLPAGFRSDLDAVHDVVGGNRREVEQALSLLTASAPDDEPMVRLEGDPGRRVLVVVAFATWCRADNSAERVRRFRERQRQAPRAVAGTRNALPAVTETSGNAGEKSREEKRREEAPVVPTGDGTTTSPGRSRSRGRAAKTLCPEGFQPRPEDAKPLVDAKLDVDAVLADFRDYWRGNGELRADWNAVFRQNVRSVLGKDTLRAKFARPAKLAPPRPVAAVGAPAPNAVPAPPGVLAALQAMIRGEDLTSVTDDKDRPTTVAGGTT